MLGGLRFAAHHKIVSLIPLPAAVVRPCVAPAERFVRALPLPACARGLGAVPYWPAGDDVHELLSRLGRPLPLSSEHEFSALWAATALIAPFYTLLQTTADWASANGALPATAVDYIAAMFHALATDALEGADDRFEALARVGATPGGLNEQALGMISAGGAYDHFRTALDAILHRITTT